MRYRELDQQLRIDPKYVMICLTCMDHVEDAESVFDMRSMTYHVKVHCHGKTDIKQISEMEIFSADRDPKPFQCFPLVDSTLVELTPAKKLELPVRLALEAPVRLALPYYRELDDARYLR